MLITIVMRRPEGSFLPGSHRRRPRLIATLVLFLITLIALAQGDSSGQAAASAAVPQLPGAAPANDDFANAIVLAGETGLLEGETNVEATTETGEPAHRGTGPNLSVWYAYTPAATGNAAFRLTVTSSYTDLVMAVYTGSSVDALTEVGSAGPSRYGLFVEARVTAGTTYYLAVAGDSASDWGTFDLAWAAGPANDDLAAATVLDPSGGSLPDQSNTDASVETGEPAHAGYGPNRSVWYAFTATATGSAKFHITVTSSSTDLVMSVYSGSGVDALMELDSAGPSRIGIFVQAPVTAGTTYYLAVAGETSSDWGTFDLDWAIGPANDSFAAATALAGDAGALGGETNVDSSAETGEPAHRGYGPFLSVWYAFTPSVSGNAVFEVDVTSPATDLVVAVYTGASVDALTQVAASGPTSLSMVVEFHVTAANTYCLAVAGQSASDWGTFDLAWVMGPANDEFAAATALVGESGSLAGQTNVNSSAEPGELAHHGYGPYRSVWYAFTAPRTGNVVFDFDVTSGYTELVAAGYSGSSVDALTKLSGVGPGALAIHLEFRVTEAQTYHVVVAAAGNFDAGEFDIDWTMGPENDEFNQAFKLAGEEPGPGGGLSGFLADQTTVHASAESGEPAHLEFGPFRSVWYSFTAAVTGVMTVTIDVTSDYADLVAAAYSGTSVDALTEVNGVGPSPLGLTLRFPMAAGTVYHVAVAAADNFDAGSFDLGWQGLEGPTNDNFAQAALLVTDAGSKLGQDNFAATAEPGEPAHAGYPATGSVWYDWTPSVGGYAVVTVTTNSPGAVLAAYTGPAVDALAPVGSGSGVVFFPIAAGTTYHLAVDGQDLYDTFTFNLYWSIRRATNDDFADAVELPGDSGSLVEQSNLWASAEPGEPDHAGYPANASVWFAWTPAFTGDARVTIRLDHESRLVAYSGSALGALTEVGAVYSDTVGVHLSHMTFPVAAGTTYHLVVDGSSPFFEFELAWRPVQPLNDDFAAASVLSADQGSRWTEGNEGATSEPGEPDHAGSPAVRSVWYRWTPDFTGTAVLDTLGSDFDTRLAVYTGASVAALTEIAANDDIAYPELVQSEVSFEAVGGTTYYIAVDGVDGAAGAINLSWGQEWSRLRISHQGPDGDPAYDASQSDVAFNSVENEFLVVWTGTVSGGYQIHGQIVDGVSGANIGFPFVISADANNLTMEPAVTFNSAENQYLVVWSERHGEAAVEVYGRRVLTDGSLIGDSFRISQVSEDVVEPYLYWAEQPDIAYNSADNEYLVVWTGDWYAESPPDPGDPPTWEDHEMIFGQRLAADGTPVGEDDFLISQVGGLPPEPWTRYPAVDARSPAVAYNETDNQYLVVFEADNFFQPVDTWRPDIHGQLLAANGLEIGPDDFRVSEMLTGQAQKSPSVAYSSEAGEYLVTWETDTILGQRLTAAGAEVGDDDFAISAAGAVLDLPDGGSPSVVYEPGADEYRVVWSGQANRAIFGQRLTSIGTESGPDDALIAHMAYYAITPTLAHNPLTGQTLAVWLGDDGTAAGGVVGESEIYAALVGEGLPSGAPVLDLIGDQDVDEGQVRHIIISAGDADDDPLNFELSGAPAFASLEDHGDGTATLTLSPGYDDAGVYPGVTITVSDGLHLDWETFTITVVERPSYDIYLPQLRRGY